MPLDARIILRPMSLADVPLLALWDRQPHVMAATSDDPDQPKAFGDTYWPDELALVGPDCQYLVAEIDGRPIGAMQIIAPTPRRRTTGGRSSRTCGLSTFGSGWQKTSVMATARP